MDNQIAPIIHSRKTAAKTNYLLFIQQISAQIIINAWYLIWHWEGAICLLFQTSARGVYLLSKRFFLFHVTQSFGCLTYSLTNKSRTCFCASYPNQVLFILKWKLNELWGVYLEKSKKNVRFLCQIKIFVYLRVDLIIWWIVKYNWPSCQKLILKILISCLL